ncbi:hypothetical protein M9Y10_006480 [Tritrichomonas musculus]|uniref:Uncharacterized protein n=1 Tax=Tritrichomonas musculus TaxID=1915356 RepID=A0ABR2JES6_9EUKA
MTQKNTFRTPKLAIGSKNSGFNTPSKESLNSSKGDYDYYRRQLMEKKTQVTALEKRLPKLDEFKSRLTQLIQDFQQAGQINFIEDDTESHEKLSHPFDTTQEGVQIIRNGIMQLISYHERLAARFEIELSKNLFTFQQTLDEKKKMLAKEEELLEIAQNEASHNKNIIQMAINEKDVLKQTILMLRSTLERHMNSDSAQRGMVHSRYERVQMELNKVQKLVQDEEEMSSELQSRKKERLTTEEKHAIMHQEILLTVEKLRADYKKESYANNLTRAALDRAKDELLQLSRAVESYHDNLKTQELLDAEVENRRLRAVLNNEKIEHEEKLARHTSKTKELSDVVESLTKRIDQLNIQISSTEQRLQTQMMRIPDFKQLGQVLDRSIEQSRKYKEFVMKRKYLLDEIRDKNRLLEQQEIQESKNRMAQLKIQMPLSSQQSEQDALLPKLYEENAEWQKQMKEFLSSTGLEYLNPKKD